MMLHQAKNACDFGRAGKIVENIADDAIRVTVSIELCTLNGDIHDPEELVRAARTWHRPGQNRRDANVCASTAPDGTPTITSLKDESLIQIPDLVVLMARHIRNRPPGAEFWAVQPTKDTL